MDSAGPHLATQCIVNYWKRPLGLSLLLIMVLMAKEAAVKKPLCINSNIVQRFDTVNSNGAVESVHSCAAYKNSGFSKAFYDHRNGIEKRVGRAESVLLSLGAHPRLSVVWSDDIKIRPISEEQVVVTSASLNGRDFETDLIESGLKSFLRTENPKFERFLAQNLTDNFDDENVFGDLWQRAKSKLSWREGLQLDLSLRRRIPQLKGLKVMSMTESLLVLLQSPDAATEKMRHHLEQVFREFGLLPSQERYDLVLELPQADAFDRDKLVQAVKKSGERRVAVKSGGAYFILPYWTPIPKPEANQMKVDLRVVFLNSDNERLNLTAYASGTEKVILFNADSKFRSIVFDDLLSGNIKKFLRVNSKFSFVQLHMPSFNFKMRNSVARLNLFEVLRDKSEKSAARTRFGWSEEMWASDVKAMRPVAVFDAIQYYRIN